MPDGLVVYRFGPFDFEPHSRGLFRRNARVRLSHPQGAILAHLLAHAGAIVAKDALTEAGWQGLAVSENSLTVAIHRLRKVLGGDQVYIETLPHHGYRFVAPVDRAERALARGPLDARLEPFVAFVQGRIQLDTLDRDRIRQVRTALEGVLRQSPEYARAHVLLAMACGLAYEASATGARRDMAALESGITHARRGCELASDSGEAWSTLAFVLDLKGENVPAAAAACKAMTLEPENWRNALRLAKVTWGEERVQAARSALTLNPGLALAYWLRATVFVARTAFDLALEELRPGCAAQDTQVHGAAFPAVGLHLLHGLVLAALGQLDDAVSELKRELGTCSTGHDAGEAASSAGGQVYASLCAANTWYAIGALLMRQRKRDEASAALARALAIAPGHVSATAALRGEVPPSASGVDAALGRAIVLARGNRHADAARVYGAALAQAPPGHAGWILPVEPLLNPLARHDAWQQPLALVRARAT